MAKKRKAAAPKRKTKRRTKRKSPARRAAGAGVDVARAAMRLAGKIDELRAELKQIKRALKKRKRRR